MISHEPVSLVMIDDIRSVVEGLKSIDWASYGVSLEGVSFNGEDGLDTVKRVKPDILITDIRMPRMDGLTLIEEMAGYGLSCKVILISSYTDFDYAKQAVQLGAFDFVVKPFTETDILRAVLKAKEHVVEERLKQLSLKDMERQVRESIPLLRQEYFSLLLTHRTPWDMAAKRWSFLKADLAPRGLTVMLLQIDDFQARAADLPVQEVELLRFSLQNVIEETIRKQTPGLVFRFGDNRFAAILNDSGFLTAAQIAERCCRNVERYTKFTVSVGVGGRAETTRELPDSCRQAERALAHHLLTGGNGAIGYDEVPGADRQPPLALEQKDELLLALRSGNAERAAGLLADFSAALNAIAPPPHPDYLLSLYQEMAAAATRTLYELVPLQELQPLVDRIRAFRGSSGFSLAEIERKLRKLCKDGAELVRRNSVTEGQAIIYKSLEFIAGRLDRSVTITESAAFVHLSPSYYASLFKKVTGMTFTQYVTNEKIHKAKALIVAGVPVQDVAAAVGYEERRYFSETFKKITGLTPSEFRESYQQGGGTSARE